MGHISDLEEKRLIAMAEILGWRGPFSVIDGDYIIGTDPISIGDRGPKYQVPRFDLDLDAMHEAECWLEKNHPRQCDAYLIELRHVIAPHPPRGLVGDFRLVNATAQQRFTAFLLSFEDV